MRCCCIQKIIPLNNIQYIGLSLKHLQIIDTELFRGIIQSTNIEKITWCNAHFNLMKMEGITVSKGVIESSSFDNCSLKNITFKSVYFRDVYFDFLFPKTIKFVACTFEKTFIGNIIDNDSNNWIELNGVQPDELKPYFDFE